MVHIELNTQHLNQARPTTNPKYDINAKPINDHTLPYVIIIIVCVENVT